MKFANSILFLNFVGVMAKLKQSQSYPLLKNGTSIGIYQVAYFDGHGNAVILFGGQTWLFDPETGYCIDKPSYQLKQIT